MTLQEWCLQYPDWCDICSIGGGVIQTGSTPEWSDRTADQAQAWSYICLVESCCQLACGDRWEQLLLAVTEDIPCEMLGVSTHELQSFLVFLSRYLQTV